jgi:hypothetical protein
MAKIDKPWNPEEEKPLAIAMAFVSGNATPRYVMTTSRGRVLAFLWSDDGKPRTWHDITPELVRETLK